MCAFIKSAVTTPDPVCHFVQLLGSLRSESLLTLNNAPPLGAQEAAV